MSSNTTTLEVGHYPHLLFTVIAQPQHTILNCYQHFLTQEA